MMLNIELNKYYFNQAGTLVSVPYLVTIDDDLYKKGYRFKDSYGRTYTASGVYDIDKKTDFDLVREMTELVLAAVPFDDINIGDEVISFRNKRGEIVEKTPDTKSRSRQDPDYQYVSIKWEGVEQLSRNSLSMLDAVRYIGSNKP